MIVTPKLLAPLLSVLIGRTAEGDSYAFAALYDCTSDRIYSFVLNVLGDPARAEDATEEIYLQIWAKARSFDPSCGSPMEWLLAIARRAVDRRRVTLLRRSRPYGCSGRREERGE